MTTFFPAGQQGDAEHIQIWWCYNEPVQTVQCMHNTDTPNMSMDKVYRVGFTISYLQAPQGSEAGRERPQHEGLVVTVRAAREESIRQSSSCSGLKFK